MYNIAILVPVYNEEKTIKKVIEDFYDELPNNSAIFIYDNNSTDNSYNIALETKKAIVCKEYKQGKGNVVRRMFREIDAKVYVLVDADDTYSAKDIQKLVSPIIYDNVDMVVGDRLSGSYFKENKRRFHNIGNIIIKKLINLFFKADIKDVMTGYRAFSRLFVKTYPCLSKNFEVETELTMHAIDKNLQIENVIINYRDRTYGSFSKLNTIIDGISVILTFVKYFASYKPFVFFNIFTIIIFIFSTIFFIPIFIEYEQTHLVRRFPTLIVCGFLYIVAIQCFFTGLMIEIINIRNKQNFEYKLIKEYIN